MICLAFRRNSGSLSGHPEIPRPLHDVCLFTECSTTQVNYSYSVWLARKRVLVTIHFPSNISVMTSLSVWLILMLLHRRMDTGPTIEQGAHVRVLIFSEKPCWRPKSFPYWRLFSGGPKGSQDLFGQPPFLVFQDHQMRRNFFRFKRQWCSGRLLWGTAHRYDIIYPVNWHCIVLFCNYSKAHL